MLEAVNGLLVIEQEIKPIQKNGLILPTEEKPYSIGQVYSTDGQRSDISVGDYVFYRKFSGMPIEYKGQKYFSLDVKNILASIKKANYEQ